MSEQPLHQIPVGGGGAGGGVGGGGGAVPTQNLNRPCRPLLAVHVLPDLI